MDAIVHRVTAWDGLPLVAREWDAQPGHTDSPSTHNGPGSVGDTRDRAADDRDPHDRHSHAGTAGDAATPLLCLPGLVRTGGDFAELARAIGAGRRVVALDYAGRGGSGRSADVTRYGPEACLRDVLDLCAALHLHQVVAIGTSFGGLLAMGLGAARPTLLRGVVLNDIGPEIGTAGGDFVRRFVADDPALADLDACVAHLRACLPPLSLQTDAAWRRMAGLTYTQGADGRFHPRWDTAIARLLDAPPPPLWPLFGALAHVPLLLAWGEASDILLPGTVAAMRAARPDMAIVSLPGIGHAPTLTEPPVLSALAAFLQPAALHRAIPQRATPQPAAVACATLAPATLAPATLARPTLERPTLHRAT